MKMIAGILALTWLCAACASKSENIQPTYLSSNMYESYTCDQLAREGQQVSRRAAIAAGQQDKNRTGDIVKTTVGVVLFWPILFANEGDGPVAAELANLKGQMRAIEEASIQKNCGIKFQKS